MACQRRWSDAVGNGGLVSVARTSVYVYITCRKSADASGLSWGIIQCCCLPNVDKGGGKILVLTVEFREC